MSISITCPGRRREPVPVRPRRAAAPRLAVTAGALLVAGLIASPAVAAPPEDVRVREHVEVHRVLIDARVVDSRGDPIEGLGVPDFKVLVDGHPAELESVEWIAGTAPYAEGVSPEVAAQTGAPVAPAGRLIVFFFQADFAQVRLRGLMHMKAKAIEFLRTLEPADQVAVVSFDSHCKLRLDFTNDRKRIARAIHQAILFGDAPAIAPGPFPSLAAGFDQAAARRAASPEAGLLVTAEALKPLPGAKSLAFFGWGLGHLARPWVDMDHAYPAARRALAAGRVSVFAIDVTDADYHDLELGLERVAADTGGFYAKTNLFPGQAMARLAGAVAGHYVLVVVRPDVAKGAHAVDVELARGAGTVLARNSFED